MGSLSSLPQSKAPCAPFNPVLYAPLAKEAAGREATVRPWHWISCFFLSSGALRFLFPNRAANNWGNESIHIWSQSLPPIQWWGNNFKWQVTVNGWQWNSAKNSTSPIPQAQQQPDICITISWIPVLLGKLGEGYGQGGGVMEKLCDEAPLGAPSTPWSLTLRQKCCHWCRGEEGRGNTQVEPQKVQFSLWENMNSESPLHYEMCNWILRRMCAC